MTMDKKYVLLPIFISLCAVILSQIKPLYVYFEDPKIDLLIGKNVNFYEGWGNLGANLFVQFVNIGDASGTVERIDIFICSKDSDYAHILTGQSYYLQPEAVNPNAIVSQMPFSYVTVNSHSVWTGFVNCYATISKGKQKTIQDFIQQVEEDIDSKWIPNGPTVTIEDDLLNRIVAFSRKGLEDFTIGEYSLLAMAWVQDDSNPILKKAYSFSVYETDKAKLYRKEKEYPFGGGIIFPIPQAQLQKMHFNSILTEITEEEAINKLYEAYKKAQL